MRKYFQDNDAYPTSNTNSTFERIRRAATSNWEEFNIYSWNYLMLFVFNCQVEKYMTYLIIKIIIIKMVNI